MHVEQLPSVDEVVSSIEAGRQRLVDVDIVGSSRAAVASARDALPHGWTIDVPEAVSSFEWPRIELPSIDVGKAVTGAAAAAHIGRRPNRARWPLAVGGLIVAGLGAWAILRDVSFRARLTSGAHSIRERVAVMRSGRRDGLEIERDHPIAFPAAETAPIEVSPTTDGAVTAATDYPTGLGSNNGNGIAALAGARGPA
jgi:hypothetical protein